MAGKDHADYYYVKWSAYAELAGEKLPIAGVSVTYQLDTLPVASLALIVGREPTNNEEAGTVEAFMEAQPYTTVKIFIKGETQMDSPKGSSDPGIPYNEDVMIFDGYLQGLTYRSNWTPAGGGTVGLTATCIGWLTALGGSVSSTQTNTVKGPGGFDEIINVSLGGENMAAFDPVSTIDVDDRGTITDIWLDYIKEVFLTLTDESNKNVWGDTSNDSAFKALQRMDNQQYLPVGTDISLALPIGHTGVDEEYMRRFLVNFIGKGIYSLWRNHDMWTVMTEMADSFKFTIVPLIDTSFCVAAIPTLNGDPYKTIGADEYYAIGYEADAQSNYTRLAIVDTTGSTPDPFAPDTKVSAVIGLYEIDGALGSRDNTRGLTKEMWAPGWLVAASPNGTLTRQSIGGHDLGIPDAVNPEAHIPENPDKSYNEIYSNYVTSQLGDDYARLALQSLFLAKRTGTLEGRFRLDIGPGSTVAIEVVNDKFSQKDAEPKKVYAIVTAVTLTLDGGGVASTGTANTQFTINHIRTQKEHDDVNITSRTHPIYDVRFEGLPLWFKK